MTNIQIKMSQCEFYSLTEKYVLSDMWSYPSIYIVHLGPYSSDACKHYPKKNKCSFFTHVREVVEFS